MNKNYLIDDAIAVCEAIIQTKSPRSKWCVVNMVKYQWSINLDHRIDSFPTYSEIPSYYIYMVDDVVEYLKDVGVIIISTNEDGWFTELDFFMNYKGSDNPYPYNKIASLPGLTFEASKLELINKGLIDKYSSNYSNEPYVFDVWDSSIQYFTKYVDFNDESGVVNYGPSSLKNDIVIIDMEKAKNLVNSRNGLMPKFDIESGKLSFKGTEIEFKGNQASMIHLLVKNCNTIVSWKNLYEENNNLDYEKELKRLETKVKAVHEQLRSIYKEIKKKIYSSDLKNFVSLVENNGFGLFVHQMRE